MKQLFIVESPLQLLNANEAIHTIKATSQTLLVRYSGDFYNDKQIQDTLKKLELHNIVTIKTLTIKGEKRNLLDFLKLMQCKIFGVLFASTFNTIFIGNYESKFMRLIIGARKNVMLLDDGSKTINTQKSFTPDNYYDWFTIFNFQPIKNQKVLKNNFSYLNKHIRNLNKDNKQVLFIGSKLSEAQVISEQYYCSLITKIAHRYNTKELVYIPHRGESSKKLQFLEHIPNLTIKRLSFPIELLSIYEGMSPSIIASFYSTALITLSKIYKVETIAFKFDYSKSPTKSDIQNVYDYCSDHIEVINEKDI